MTNGNEFKKGYYKSRRKAIEQDVFNDLKEKSPDLVEDAEDLDDLINNIFGV